MSLARAWMRQLYGASGMALLVPGTIACALAVLAFAGGFSRFNSIDQAFSGPAVPVDPLAAGRTEARASAGLSQTLATLGRSGFAPVPDARGHLVLAASGHTVAAPGVRSTSPPSSGARSPVKPPHHTVHAHPRPKRPSSSPTAGTPTSAPATTTSTTPASTLGNGVSSLGAAVGARVPGPVGAAVSGTLQSLGATLGRVLPAPLGSKS